ncbi:SDR family oxidoreductase [Streptomyces pristinaespiralis]|uniref:SDR family oxidoreductase n=1 Tax=Streptomyces pristinaespiralis TaxID=38300 RepID=UPI0038332D9B
MTILVTGSRGKVGSALVALLHRQGLRVRAGSASPGDLTFPADVETVRCALDDPSTFPAALDSVTSVFLYAEPSHTDAFVAQAHAAGVGHIVLLSSSAVMSPDAADNPIAASHLLAEQALAAGPVEATVLRPGAFAGNALQWAGALRSTGALDLPYPQSHGDPIHEDDIARVAAAVLTGQGPRGGTHHLTGPQSITFAEQIATLSRAAGRTTPVDIRTVTREQWMESVSAFLPGEFARALLDHWASTDGSPAVLTRAVEELTGRPARTFGEWAEEHADAFRADQTT